MFALTAICKKTGALELYQKFNTQLALMGVAVHLFFAGRNELKAARDGVPFPIYLTFSSETGESVPDSLDKIQEGDPIGRCGEIGGVTMLGSDDILKNGGSVAKKAMKAHVESLIKNSSLEEIEPYKHKAAAIAKSFLSDSGHCIPIFRSLETGNKVAIDVILAVPSRLHPGATSFCNVGSITIIQIA